MKSARECIDNHLSLAEGSDTKYTDSVEVIEAMMEDYASMKVDKAIKKIKRTIGKIEANKPYKVQEEQ